MRFMFLFFSFLFVFRFVELVVVGDSVVKELQSTSSPMMTNVHWTISNNSITPPLKRCQLMWSIFCKSIVFPHMQLISFWLRKTLYPPPSHNWRRKLKINTESNSKQMKQKKKIDKINIGLHNNLASQQIVRDFNNNRNQYTPSIIEDQSILFNWHK